MRFPSASLVALPPRVSSRYVHACTHTSASFYELYRLSVCLSACAIEQLLQLQTWGYVDTEQLEPFQEIFIQKTDKTFDVQLQSAVAAQ